VPPAPAPSSSFGIGKLMSMGFLGKQLYDLGGRPFRYDEQLYHMSTCSECFDLYDECLANCLVVRTSLTIIEGP
jgi:hypothetical protein